MAERRSTSLRAPWWSRAASAVPVVLVCAFLLLPLVVVAVSSFNASSNFRFPPSGFSLRWYADVFASQAWLSSLGNSLVLALVTAPVVVVLGTLGGYAIGAGRFPGRRALSVLFLSPLAVPGIMIGLALLYQFQSTGMRGAPTGIWIAHLVVTFPFCVRVAAVSAAALDRRLVHAARVLGASRLRAFLTVTVPLMRPGIIASAFLAAVISLGEVAVSVFVSGTGTTTVPVRIYSAVQVQLEPSVAAVSTLLLLLSVVTIAVLDRTVRISRFL
ncbi:ABC transporter permease [Microbacterium marinilacus]|uniref:ABC transporter permease n=1 Tax=Microbacterium marinilacus TaxID=415209 RepID=A0ABP7BLP4_9MICO|nr:ABC transporter permease [Microbacterium marinilacus]MBY0689716.1 ABC transporter permease [Microbacterium marinilacus]